jgi:hypothetical protein
MVDKIKVINDWKHNSNQQPSHTKRRLNFWPALRRGQKCEDLRQGSSAAPADYDVITYRRAYENI